MAPINFTIPRYQRREFVAAPLEIYSNSLGTLQQRHEQAIEQSNAVKTFLANKQLNEEENKWLYDYSKDIERQIEDAVESGSYATALTTAKTLAGKVASDPALIGRERYQQQYQQFQEQVKSSKDYDEDIKRYTLAQNRYGYKDTVDEKGNVVGGNAFNPNYTPVTQVDYNELYDQVLKSVGVDSSQGGQLVWGDESGNLKDGAGNIAAGDVPYLKTTSGIQKLDANKIQVAMEAALNASPGARASLAQDYRVNTWKASKGENNIVTKPDGTIMSQKEFEQSMFAPRYKTSAYTRITRDVDPSIGFNMLNAARKASASSKESGKTPDYVPSFNIVSGNIKYTPASVSDLQAEKSNYQTALRNEFAKYGLDKSLSDTQGYQVVRNRILSSNIDESIKRNQLANLDNIYNKFQDSNNRLEATKAHLTPDEQEANEFLGNKYSLGNMADSTNKYQKDYANRINKIFTTKEGTNYENMILNPSTDQDKNHIITVLRQDLGLSRNDAYFKTINGKEQIVLTKEAYAKYGDVIADALIKDGTPGGRTAYSTLLYNNEQDIRPIEGITSNSRASINFINNKFGINEPIVKANAAKAKGDSRIAKRFTTMIPIKTSNIPLEIQAMNRGMEEDQVKAHKESILTTVRSAAGGNLDMKVRDENNVFNPVDDSNQRNAIIQLLASRDAKDIEITSALNPITGRIEQQFTIPFDTKQGKNAKKFANSDLEDKFKYSDGITFIVDAGDISPEIAAFNNSPQVKTLAKLNNIQYNSVLNRGYTLTPNEFGDGTAEAGIKDGQWYIRENNQEIPVTREIMEAVVNTNKRNEVYINAIQTTAEILKRENGSISNTPVAEVNSRIVAPLYEKAFADYGYDIRQINASQVPDYTRSIIEQHFNTLYYNTTGEMPSLDVIKVGFNKE